MYLDLVLVVGLHVYSCLCVFLCMWFTAYSISCIRSRVYMFLNLNFSYISTRVVIYHQKGGDCSDLGPFAPLVRVCFSDK
jgi:hypothetical protein